MEVAVAGRRTSGLLEPQAGNKADFETAFGTKTRKYSNARDLPETSH